MAMKILTKLSSTISLENLQIENLKNFVTSSLNGAKQTENFCPMNKGSNKREKNRWFWRFSKEKCSETRKTEKEIPSPELCNQTYKGEIRPDPDLSSFGGTPYRTCGSAYIIQKEKLPQSDGRSESVEQKILEKLEKHPDLKEVEDTMPPFESVEKRMLDLDERKLHPLYKKYIFLTKRPSKINVSKFAYKSRSGPVSTEDIPARLKCNREMLEKKNIFSEFKRVDPPRQLLARMLEIQLNEKPTMKRTEEEVEVKAGKVLKS